MEGGLSSGQPCMAVKKVQLCHTDCTDDVKSLPGRRFCSVKWWVSLAHWHTYARQHSGVSMDLPLQINNVCVCVCMCECRGSINPSVPTILTTFQQMNTSVSVRKGSEARVKGISGISSIFLSLVLFFSIFTFHPALRFFAHSVRLSHD